jgi:hypothetical protein
MTAEVEEVSEAQAPAGADIALCQHGIVLGFLPGSGCEECDVLNDYEVQARQYEYWQEAMQSREVER